MRSRFPPATRPTPIFRGASSFTHITSTCRVVELYGRIPPLAGGRPALQSPRYCRSMPMTDWVAWHANYDDPASRFSQRLAVLQRHLRVVLDAAPPGPIRAVSLCAGQGHDLLGALAEHPRRDDAVATLVEFDPRNAELARARAHVLAVPHVKVVTADAGVVDSYVGVVPASLVLISGFLSYVTDRDVARLPRALTQLCAPDAVVVWCRSRADVWQCRLLRRQFQRAGFESVDLGCPEDPVVIVGVERFGGPPEPVRPGTRLFTFRDPRSSRPALVRHRLRRRLHRIRAVRFVGDTWSSRSSPGRAGGHQT